MAFASLTIDLAARLTRFEGDLGKMAHMAERQAQRIDRAFAGVSRTLGALGGLISVGGFVALGRELIGAASNLDDMAEKTGASVEELSRLEQQARISGTQIETVETALVRLSKGLHENDEEAKKVTKALSALGLKAEDLRNLDTADALRVVADRMNQFADGSGKTALALDLFGKSAAQVLPFLKDLANDARTASNVTKEQAAKAEELEKSLRRLGNEARNLAQTFAFALVPGMLKWTEQLNEAVRITGSLAGAFTFLFPSNPFKSAAEQIGSLNKELEKLAARKAESLERRGTWSAELDKDIAAAQKRLEFWKFVQRQEALTGRTGLQFMDARDLRAGRKDTLDDYTESVDKLGKAVKGTADPFEQMKRQMEEQLAKTGELNLFEQTLALFQTERYAKLLPAQREELLRLAAAVDLRLEDIRVTKEATQAVEAFNQKSVAAAISEGQRLNALIEHYTDLVDPMAKYRRQLEELDMLRQKRPGQADIFGKAEVVVRANMWDAQLDALEKLGIKIRDIWAVQFEMLGLPLEALGLKVENKTEEMTEFFRQAARNMQDAMADGFFNILQGKFDDLGSRFKTMIDRMVANLLASQLNNFLFGKNFGQAGVNLGGAVGDFAKWLGLPRFDVGTPFVPRDMVAVVHRGERIVPADENRIGRSGTTIVVHNKFVISAPIDRRSQNQILLAAAQGIRRVVDRDG